MILLLLLSFLEKGGDGNPLQYSRLENPMDIGAWRATVHVITESDRTEHLSTNAFTLCLLSFLLTLFMNDLLSLLYVCLYQRVFSFYNFHVFSCVAFSFPVKSFL